MVDALQKDPDTVLVRARAVAKNRADLVANQIFNRLIGVGEQPASKVSELLIAGKPVATLKTGRQGRVVVEFEPGALPAARHSAFVTLVEAFLAKGV